MYQTAGKLFKLNGTIKSTNTSKGSRVYPQQPIIKKSVSFDDNIKEDYRSQFDQTKSIDYTDIVKNKNDDKYYLRDPYVWGPLFWFILHNGASKYPISASTISKERMKGFILGIPTMIPCEECSDHSRIYINDHIDIIDNITAGRDSLFEFFYDFHETVNKRLDKKSTITLQEAKDIYYEQS